MRARTHVRAHTLALNSLAIALTHTHACAGSLYVDDGDGYAFQTGHYVHRTLEFNQNTVP
jgi:hypothetical protein